MNAFFDQFFRPSGEEPLMSSGNSILTETILPAACATVAAGQE
jgi:hypothetical protein